MTQRTNSVLSHTVSRASTDHAPLNDNLLTRAGMLLWPRSYMHHKRYEEEHNKDESFESSTEEFKGVNEGRDEDDDAESPTTLMSSQKLANQRRKNRHMSRTQELGDGQKALLHFKQFCISRYKNILRAWHQLDTDGNMNLGLQEFRRGCERVRYHGNINQLWKFLDRDSSGTVTLL